MTVHLERHGGVAVLTLDNPPLNLLTMRLRRELAELAAGLAADDGCRAVVLTATGRRAFSAGSDVREFPADEEEGAERARREHEWFAALERLPQPTIAALHGHVLGGGLELALTCDLRIADDTARMGLPEVGLGMLPCGGGTQRLPRLVGPARAKEMLLTGEPIDAHTAHGYGIVQRVVATGADVATAREVAGRIAAAPTRTTQAIKSAIDAGTADGMDVGLALEVELAGPLFASERTRAAVRPFLRKQPLRNEEGAV